MIRIAELDDMLAIATTNPFPSFDQAGITEALQEKRLWVYLEQGMLSGFISLARGGLLGRAYVQYLAVAAEQRRKGIAAKLLSELELVLSQLEQSERLFISTENDNLAMQTLLAARGYQPAGEIRGANSSGQHELYYYKDLS